jgi:two-component system C4-dicarboxylate transport response regulator DctD
MTANVPGIVLVDDDPDLRHALAQGLELEGYRVETASGAEEALGLLTRDFAGAVVSDIRMPGLDGIGFLGRVLEIDSAIPVVLITGHGDVALAVQAMRAGAYDFLEKPFTPERLAETVSRAVEKRGLVIENRTLREARSRGDGLADVLVGGSAAMQQLRERVRAIAATDADVIVEGETGSGKEVVSRAIHHQGSRRDGPFVAINCGALPSEIIESELFGHERGAFTGAGERRIGRIEHANGGTLLLDEIESMPIDLQVKLLRVLEERAVTRLGSNKPQPIDVRFIAATKSDLKALSETGKFRADLFYRLNVIAIRIAPLRERREDVGAIFLHLAREAAVKYRRDVPDVPAAMLQHLAQHDWPGNVRELRNAADRFVLGLGAGLATGSGGDTPANGTRATIPLAEQVAEFERAAIAAALARHGQRIRPVYEELGISRKTLYEKMRRYGL